MQASNLKWVKFVVIFLGSFLTHFKLQAFPSVVFCKSGWNYVWNFLGSFLGNPRPPIDFDPDLAAAGTFLGRIRCCRTRHRLHVACSLYRINVVFNISLVHLIRPKKVPAAARSGSKSIGGLGWRIRLFWARSVFDHFFRRLLCTEFVKIRPFLTRYGPQTLTPKISGLKFQGRFLRFGKATGIWYSRY